MQNEQLPRLAPLRARLPRLLVVAGVLPTLFGCLAYNECKDERGGVLGNLATELDIRKSVIRTQESPVGNLVADALLAAARTYCSPDGVPCPDLAIQNAGGLRQETACGSRDNIPVGPMYEQDLVDLMPFINQLAVVTMKGRDVRLALEHSVDKLGLLGEEGAPGHFLQVAGARYEVDCAGAPQVAAGDLTAIEEPGGRLVYRENGAVVPGQYRISIIRDGETEPLDDDADYNVAMNSYLAGGNDGYLAFLLRDADDNVIFAGEDPATLFDPESDILYTPEGDVVTDRAAVAAYIRQRTDTTGSVGGPPEGRILVNSCFGGSLAP